MYNNFLFNPKNINYSKRSFVSLTPVNDMPFSLDIHASSLEKLITYQYYKALFLVKLNLKLFYFENLKLVLKTMPN